MAKVTVTCDYVWPPGAGLTVDQLCQQWQGGIPPRTVPHMCDRKVEVDEADRKKHKVRAAACLAQNRAHHCVGCGTRSGA